VDLFGVGWLLEHHVVQVIGRLFSGLFYLYTVLSYTRSFVRNMRFGRLLVFVIFYYNFEFRVS